MAATGLVTLEVPREYGYVLLTTTFTFILATWHGARIGSFRKPAKIPYPHHYAPMPLPDSTSTSDSETEDKALQKSRYLFNCAQRAHANFLENYTTFTLAMLIAGVRYPLISSVMGVAWGVQRVVYAVGYTRADKENGRGRLMGSGYALPQVVLMVLAGWTGWCLLAV